MPGVMEIADKARKMNAAAVQLIAEYHEEGNRREACMVDDAFTDLTTESKARFYDILMNISVPA